MTDSLTEFALKLYRAQGVEEECLAWQSRMGVSVPLLLCCVWLDARGVGAQPEPMAHRVARVLAWEQQVVWPARQLRRDLKPLAEIDSDAQAIRLKIKQAELAAELVVLDKLAALPWPPSDTSALKSFVSLYIGNCDCDPFPALRRAMREIAPDGLTGPIN